MSDTTMVPLYRAIASTLMWDPKDIESVIRRLERLGIYDEMLPSGSGIDGGCAIEEDKYSDKYFVIRFGYHHMDNGVYTYWTRHSAIVTASLGSDTGFTLKFTGPGSRGGDDYLYEYLNDVFTAALTEMVSQYPEVE